MRRDSGYVFVRAHFLPGINVQYAILSNLFGCDLGIALWRRGLFVVVALNRYVGSRHETGEASRRDFPRLLTAGR
jgi:hypothetical protein